MAGSVSVGATRLNPSSAPDPIVLRASRQRQSSASGVAGAQATVALLRYVDVFDSTLDQIDQDW